MFSPALRSPMLAPDAIKEGGKALGKGAIGFLLGNEKDGKGNAGKCKKIGEDLLDNGSLDNNLPIFPSGYNPFL